MPQLKILSDQDPPTTIQKDDVISHTTIQLPCNGQR